MNISTETTKVVSMSPVELMILRQILDTVPDHQLTDPELQVATEFKAAIQADAHGK